MTEHRGPGDAAGESAVEVNGRPLVSVLIGCWNNADTIRGAINSILGQTLDDIELIVVDDGSTDRTPEIVSEAEQSDPRVRYLPLVHAGIAPSLNEGLRAALAEVVAFQDADDWSLPTRLERELAVLEARPEVAVVGCRMDEIDSTGRPLSSRTKFAAGVVNGILPSFNPIPNSCAMVRRSAVLAVGGFDARYRYAMDYDLWLRLADLHVVLALDEVLAVRRMGEANVAARKERAQIAEAIRIRVETMHRRRTLTGVSGLALPMLSFGTPIGLKRRVRRLRGQAP
jgi:glycosyltransferase involved in cell wall biosynthesis